VGQRVGDVGGRPERVIPVVRRLPGGVGDGGFPVASVVAVGGDVARGVGHDRGAPRGVIDRHGDQQLPCVRGVGLGCRGDPPGQVVAVGHGACGLLRRSRAGGVAAGLDQGLQPPVGVIGLRGQGVVRGQGGQRLRGQVVGVGGDPVERVGHGLDRAVGEVVGLGDLEVGVGDRRAPRVVVISVPGHMPELVGDRGDVAPQVIPGPDRVERRGPTGDVAQRGDLGQGLPVGVACPRRLPGVRGDARGQQPGTGVAEVGHAQVRVGHGEDIRGVDRVAAVHRGRGDTVARGRLGGDVPVPVIRPLADVALGVLRGQRFVERVVGQPGRVPGRVRARQRVPRGVELRVGALPVRRGRGELVAVEVVGVRPRRRCPHRVQRP